jgi:hypothetical protein
MKPLRIAGENGIRVGHPRDFVEISLPLLDPITGGTKLDTNK